MRKSCLILASFVLFTLSLFAFGCAGQGLSTLDKPEDMLKKALDSSRGLTSLTATFEADLQVHLDPSQMSQEDLALLGMFQGPVTLSGTLVYSARSQAFDVDVTLGTAGFTYNMGLRVVEEQGWIRMLGQWYDFTSELQSADDWGMSLWEEAYTQEELERQLDRMGIALEDWFGEPELVGAEELAGTAVYHLKCAPDMELMVADVMTMLQDREFLELVDPTGSLLESMGQDLPSLGDIQSLVADMPEVFQDLTLDLWVGKNDGILRQATGYMSFVPPAEADMDEVDGIELTATMTLDSVNKPVRVAIPEQYLPLSALGQMFGDPSGLMPFMGPGEEDGIFNY